MGLWRCKRCDCTFAVGLPYCPQCTGTNVTEDTGESLMPKITRHGGVTVEGQAAAEPDSPDEGTDEAASAADTDAEQASAPAPEADDQAKKAAAAKKAPAAKRAASGGS